MPYLLNIIYLATLLILSPWLAYKAVTTGKLRRGFWVKLTGRVTLNQAPDIPPPAPPCEGGEKFTVWFHGVSVGEIHLLRQVVAKYRARHPEHRCVVSTTTDTGFDEAKKAFPDLDVIYWPFDFTWAVKAALKRVRPNLVVLAEGEIWPNFVRIASSRGIKLAIVNGRMSPRSAARYQKLRWLTRGVLGKIDLVAAQTEEYAEGFRLAGAPNAMVTGSVKYDGAQSDRANPKTLALRQLLGIRRDETVWVAGSTQDPEERFVLDIYKQARELHPNLRLILVPRQKDRFEPVAELIKHSGFELVRRSALAVARDDYPSPPAPLPKGERGEDVAASVDPFVTSPLHSFKPVILVDTFGELSGVWGLADVAFVGGSLDGQRGGQNMIEPAAYGAAVVFGPHTWNFKDTVARLLACQAAVQVDATHELHRTVLKLLSDAERRQGLGESARRFVRSQQGATDRTLDALDALISHVTSNPLAA